MQFVTLNVVLGAIGARVELSQSARIADLDDQVWTQNINEGYFRYSKAAALFDHHLVNADSERLPRWLDTIDGTGYARPSDAARIDGMKFLLEQAAWYPRWLKFHREFRARCWSVGGRWGGPQTEADYMRDCPPNPAFSEQFSKRVQEVGFDLSAIIAFLDLSALPHALSLPDAPPAQSMPGAVSQPQESDADTLPSATDHGALPVTAKSSGTWGNSMASRGRKALIGKAILHARSLAGDARENVDAVFIQLIKIASEYPDKFPPLSRYKDGQILYWTAGSERPYSKKALAAFLRRRKSALEAP